MVGLDPLFLPRNSALCAYFVQCVGHLHLHLHLYLLLNTSTHLPRCLQQAAQPLWNASSVGNRSAAVNI